MFGLPAKKWLAEAWSSPERRWLPAVAYLPMVEELKVARDVEEHTNFSSFE